MNCEKPNKLLVNNLWIFIDSNSAAQKICKKIIAKIQINSKFPINK